MTTCDFCGREESDEAQTLTYLRLSGCKIGLLMNFNSVMLKDGLRRFIA